MVGQQVYTTADVLHRKGSWSASSGSNFYALIDEPQIPNDSDSIYSDSAQEFKVELRQIHPTSGTYNAVAGSTTVQYGEGKRYKNTTKIAERTVFDATTEFISAAHTFKYTLTSAEKTIINDYTKLEVWFYADLDIIQMTIGGMVVPVQPTGEVSMYVRTSAGLL